VKVFLTFSPISSTDEVFAGFSRFQESYSLCIRWKNIFDALCE
jgi:hypothetical protein